jgi:hypothetical protein
LDAPQKRLADLIANAVMAVEDEPSVEDLSPWPARVTRAFVVYFDAMAIRPGAQRYFDEHLDLVRIARALDEAFDITYAADSAGLSYWFGEAKPGVAQRFGLTQEVVIIYSPHPRTDARVLTMIENLSRLPDYRYRVEKLLALVIHAGDPDQVARLIATQKDWAIASFTVDELSRSGLPPMFVRQRIASAIGTMDLFGLSAPVRSDAQLYGRDELVQILINRIIAKGESSGLFGLRKTGKTSVLFAVRRRLEGTRTLTTYLDCQSPGHHGGRWWQLLQNIRDAFAEAAKLPPVGHPYRRDDAAVRFSRDLRALISNSQSDRAVLMLDEIEYVTPDLAGALGKHWDDDFIPFWQTIRAVTQETQGQLTFIVAGVNPASVEVSHFSGARTNPILGLAVPQYLEPLDRDNLREMVRTIGRYDGVVFEEPIYDMLCDTYGGHPYLVRLACSEVVRRATNQSVDRLLTVPLRSFSDAARTIAVRLESPVKDILLSLNWWYRNEYLELLRMAKDNSAVVSETDIARFIRYGVLTSDGKQFAILPVREYLVTGGEVYDRELSPFRRGDFPPEWLPEVPDLKRLGDLFQQRTELEISMRRVIAIVLQSAANFDKNKFKNLLLSGVTPRHDRKDPRQLFVGRKPVDVLNELYTLDLKSIILVNWNHFQAIFESRERFAMNMDTLNIARKPDAHTKPVTSEDFEAFMNSYHWLKRKVAKVQV